VKTQIAVLFELALLFSFSNLSKPITYQVSKNCTGQKLTFHRTLSEFLAATPLRPLLSIEIDVNVEKTIFVDVLT